MKRYFYLSLLILASIGLSFNLFAQTTRNTKPAPKAAPTTEILTNESVISLVKANFKEKTIISLIRTSNVDFEVSANKLIQLKKNGVNENIIQAMIERHHQTNGMPTLRDDEFFTAEDEEFFKSKPKLSIPELDRKNSRENSDASKNTDIFGSRSGGKSSTRTRGGVSGDSEGASEISGSATVRIIRPPSEGSSEPKLERAPKITNKDIIEMVEAGFSEGTILRKIEITQVDFDVTPKALETLRKNRVSEKVLQAMRTAMDESK